MKRSGLIVATIALSAALSACGGSNDKAASTTTTHAVKKTTTTTAPSAQAASLEPKLIKNILPGYKQEVDSVGDTGPSDLDKAVRDDGSPDARTVLTKDGFVAGYQRLWTKGDNEIVDFVYLFANATGANDYLQRSVEGMSQADEGTTVTTFSVTGVPGAQGFLAHSSDGDAAIVAFARGTYQAQIVVNGTDATQANAQSLAKQQYDNLA